MAGREAIWRKIVAAHRAGEIDLARQSLDDVAAIFECSDHTVKTAKHHLGIVGRARRGWFENEEGWNAERGRLLEGWR